MATKSLRRKQFRAALALAGKTQSDFAATLGITPAHLSLVVRGERESQRVATAVDGFIAKHLPMQESAA